MMNKEEMKLVVGILTGTIGGGLIGHFISEKKKRKLLQQIIDGTTKELNEKLNEAIIAKNDKARKQLIEEAERQRNNLIDDVNDKLDINRFKKELINRIDKEVIDDVLREAKNIVSDVKNERRQILAEAEKERNELRKNYCDFTNNVNKRLDRINAINDYNSMLGNNNRQFKDLDYNTRTMIEKILKDDKLSGEEKARLIEALKQC